ncbi:MAG: hypothetical protein ABSB82_17055 [Terriglobia bacterium]|jgi:hypothetical protein
MMARYLQPEEPKQSALEMALAAIEGRPNPLDDAEMAKVSTEPGSLDLPETEHQGMCSNRRRTRSDVDECIVCGQPLCED